MGFFSGRRDDQGEWEDPSALPPALGDQPPGPPTSPQDPAALPASFGGAGSNASTPPLSRERIAAALGENGSTYFIDSDGDVGLNVNGSIFYIFQLGKDEEILQVRGVWSRVADIEHLREILEFCNKWNAEMHWPKTYARVRDDGAIHVNTEVSTDLEHGASDEQLLQLIKNGIGSGNYFFTELNSRFPDPIAPKSQ